MTVHVDHSQEVQTHGCSQATERRATEDQTVLVGLVVRGQVVKVQELDLEHCREGAVTQVAKHEEGEHLYGQEVVVRLGRIDDQCEDREYGRLAEERHFRPHDHDAQHSCNRTEAFQERWVDLALPIPLRCCVPEQAQVFGTGHFELGLEVTIV